MQLKRLRLSLVLVIALLAGVLPVAATATDNRQDVYDHTAHAQNAMIVGRAAASGFHVPEARVAYLQAQADITAILADLDTLAPQTNGALTIAPYPAEFRVHMGDPLSYQFQPLGGTAPYICMRLSGTIPAGLTLAPSCLLSGTVGMYPPGADFVIGVMDGNGGFVSGAVWIHVLS